MNIGDLFFTGRLDGTPLQLDAKKAAEAAADVAGQSFGQRLKQVAGGAFPLGVGIAAGQAAFGLLSNAAHEAIGLLEDSVHQAMANEVAYTKLAASLRANIPEWDGNIDAIKAANEAGSALGFTDNEMADSLARLVAATHDVAEAQRIRAVAQDLSRFSGISLLDASEALTKVEAGSYRILKSLGIQLPKNATQVEALAAVEKIAGGQATAFAKTTAGSFEVMNAKIEQAKEKIGNALIPAIADLTTFLGTLADAIDGSTRDQIQGWEAQTAAIQDGKASIAGFADLYMAVSQAQLNHIAITNSEVESLNRSRAALDLMAGAANEAASQERNVGFAAEHAKPGVDGLTDATGRLTGTTWLAVASESALADMIYGPGKSLTAAVDHAKDHIADLKGQIDVLNKKDKKTPADQRALAELQADLDTANASLLIAEAQKVALTGGKVPAELNKYLKTSAAHLTTMKSDAIKAYEMLKQMAGLGVIDVHIDVKKQPGTGQTAFASGGFVAPGVSGTVGETAMEHIYAVPGGGAWITPIADSGGSSRSGGTTYQVNVQGLLRARSASEIGDSLRRLADFGALAPRGFAGE